MTRSRPTAAVALPATLQPDAEPPASCRTCRRNGRDERKEKSRNLSLKLGVVTRLRCPIRQICRVVILRALHRDQDRVAMALEDESRLPLLALVEDVPRRVRLGERPRCPVQL